jgi:hypothetical protein
MWSDPDDVENWGVSPRGAGWLFGGSVTREVSPPSLSLSLFLCLRCMCSSIMSTRFPSSHAHINLCKRATNICLTRRSLPCGLRQITVIAVGTWPRFSSFRRTEHGASRCMVPLKKTSAIQRNNGHDVRCVAYSIVRGHLERLIRDFLLKREIYHILCRSRWMSSYRFQYTLNSTRQLKLIANLTCPNSLEHRQ